MQNHQRQFHLLMSMLIIMIAGGMVSLVPLNIQAQQVQSQKAILQSGQNGFKITQNDNNGFHFINRLAALAIHEEGTSKGIFSVIGAEGYASTQVAGDPSLPILRKLIEVPENASIKITITKAIYKEYKTADLGIRYPIMPAQLPVPKNDIDPRSIPFALNATTYSSNSYGDTVTVRTLDAGVLRGVRLMQLEVAVVKYNPVAQKLRICTELEVDITYSTPKSAQVTNLSSPYFENIFSLTANHSKPSSKALIVAQPVTYVILSNPLFKTTLKPFIDWKAQKGFNVIEAYTDNPVVGNTPATIKQYLQNLYSNPPAGMSPPTFLLIVGDVNLLPSFHSDLGQHVTDLYYAEYTGDKLPEIFYGRFPASNVAELQVMIDKTLEYEKYQMPDPSYLAKATLISGADASHQLNWSNGQIRYASDNYFNAAQNIDAAVVLQPSSISDVDKAIQSISSGVGFADYTAHCSAAGWSDPKFTTAELSSLKNDHKYTLMVGNCCLSARFDQDCFAKAVLTLPGKGAIGYIGGSNDTYWDEDYWWSTGFKAITGNPAYDVQYPGALDGAFHTHNEVTDQWFITQGQLLVAGNMAVEQSNSTLKAYYWEIYCLMGDPSLTMYYGIPKTLKHDYQQLLPIGATSFIINSEPNAYTAISMNGKLAGAAMAGNDGVAVVNLIPFTLAGDADVVITKQNSEPFIGKVRVDAPTGAYMLLSSYTLHDAIGNNDGFADDGEQPTLNINLKNFGKQASRNLSLKLTSQDSLVTIKQAVSTLPSVASADSAILNDAFQIIIDSLTPDRHIANLSLEVTDGTNSWTSNFTLPIRSGILELGTEIIYDPAPGNGNGMMDPGETITLKIPIKNTGHSKTTQATLSLSTDNQSLKLNNSSVVLGDLLPGEQKTAEFNITAASNTPVGTMTKVSLQAKSGGNYIVNKDYLLSIGVIDEDFETNNFDHLPWEQSGSLPWTISNINPEQGTFSARSGAINDGQSSTLSILFDILKEGKISFYRKTSSEAGYDRLLFYIDNQLTAEWSGQQDWENVSFDVTTGSHTFRWTYLKDGATSAGSDCAWIDNIVFPPVNTSPLIQPGALVINDDSGNKNGQLDPGETVTFNLPVENKGLTPAVDAIAKLTSNSPYITINQPEVKLGTMVRGTQYQPRFTATINATAPIGEAVDLEFHLDALSTSAQKSFIRVIGNSPLTEDFERGNFNTLNWLSGGNNPWTIENTSSSLTGKFSARSCVIKDLQSSDLMITVEVVADDSIRFILKTSTEDKADFLKFYIDGQERGSWSGKTSWSRVAFAVNSGIHTFKWSYSKDYNVSSGSDAVWIDNIQFPPISPSLPLATLASVSSANICKGESALLSVKASGGSGVYSYSWKPSAGLSDPLSANPVATSLVSTDYLVEVNDGSVTSSTSLHLNVLALPAKPVITLSGDGKTLYSSAYQANQWFKDTVAIEGAVNPGYTPTENGNYAVKVIDSPNCPSERSLLFHFTTSGLSSSDELSLLNFSPNPFNDMLNVNYTVTNASAISLTLCDLMGRDINQLVEKATQSPGNYQLTLNLQSLKSGIYLLVMKTQEKTIIRKVVKN
jgi:hypothetical protein